MRIAGKAGIGEGDRAYRAWVDGELAAFDPLNDDRLEWDLSKGGGGNMVEDGVLGTDAVGVKRGLPSRE